MSIGLLSFAVMRFSPSRSGSGRLEPPAHRIQTPRLMVLVPANGHMSDPIRRGISEDLHAVSFGKGVACDYHERPKELAVDEPMLAECIRVAAHPQLTEFPDGWVVDAARCAEHAVEGIVEPTEGSGRPSSVCQCKNRMVS